MGLEGDVPARSLGLKDLRVKYSKINDLAAIWVHLLSKNAQNWNWVRLRWPPFQTDGPWPCPKQMSLSRIAGWLSVMSGPGICDEKGRGLGPR